MFFSGFPPPFGVGPKGWELMIFLTVSFSGFRCDPKYQMPQLLTQPTDTSGDRVVVTSLKRCELIFFWFRWVMKYHLQAERILVSPYTPFQIFHIHFLFCLTRYLDTAWLGRQSHAFPWNRVPFRRKCPRLHTALFTERGAEMARTVVRNVSNFALKHPQKDHPLAVGWAGDNTEIPPS